MHGRLLFRDKPLGSGAERFEGKMSRPMRFLTLGGVEKSVGEWSTELGLNRQTIINRLSKGWTVEEALTIPPGERKDPRAKACAGCRHWRTLYTGTGIFKHCCYFEDTGQLRTVYRGIHVERCGRKRTATTGKG